MTTQTSSKPISRPPLLPPGVVRQEYRRAKLWNVNNYQVQAVELWDDNGYGGFKDEFPSYYACVFIIDGPPTKEIAFDANLKADLETFFSCLFDQPITINYRAEDDEEFNEMVFRLVSPTE